MSNTLLNLDKYSPIEIIAAVRAKDKEVIYALAHELIKVRKIWTLDEFVEVLATYKIKIDKSTVSRWSNKQ